MLSAVQFASCFCCIALCLAQVQEETVTALQEYFNSLTKSQKSQWILDWIWTHHRLVLWQCLFHTITYSFVANSYNSLFTVLLDINFLFYWTWNFSAYTCNNSESFS